MPLRRVLASILLLALPALAPADPPAPLVELPDDGAPVLRFVQGLGEAAEGSIVLEAWADGTARVERPAFHRASEKAEAQLGRDRIHGLVQSLVARGLADFNPGAAKRELAKAKREEREAAQARPGEVVVTVSSDPEPILVELRLARLGRQGAGGPVEEDVTIRIEWTGLVLDARQHPGIPGLKGLREAHEDLLAFLDLPELQ